MIWDKLLHQCRFVGVIPRLIAWMKRGDTYKGFPFLNDGWEHVHLF
jgi:hypothetical protein